MVDLVGIGSLLFYVCESTFKIVDICLLIDRYESGKKILNAGYYV